MFEIKKTKYPTAVMNLFYDKPSIGNKLNKS